MRVLSDAFWSFLVVAVASRSASVDGAAKSFTDRAHRVKVVAGLDGIQKVIQEELERRGKEAIADSQRRASRAPFRRIPMSPLHLRRPDYRWVAVVLRQSLGAAGRRA